jgi:DnaA regulatory inactivator Hda
MQLVMPFAPSDSYEPADFIRGTSNEAALDLVERWPDWPYSIVLIHGEKGSGKTHLAHVFAKRARATMLAAARVGKVPADQLLAGNHSWVLDDVDAITDAPALAQLINHVRARGDYLLLTAHSTASEMNITLPDLRSRMVALPTLGLDAPDDALLAGVLAKQFADRQLRISPEILDFSIKHIERSYRAAQAFVRAIDQLSMAKGRSVTIPLVREALNNPDWNSC